VNETEETPEPELDTHQVFNPLQTWDQLVAELGDPLPTNESE
jgi:hypothetical protein